MKNKYPVVRQCNWYILIAQLTFISIFVWKLGAIEGSIASALLIIVPRNLITKKHRKGMRLLKKGNFDEAIVCFQESYDFFDKNEALNKYVAPLFSASKITYKEMALLDLAFCYLKKQEGAKAKSIYEQTLREFPNSMMAKHTLEVFDVIKNVE